MVVISMHPFGIRLAWPGVRMMMEAMVVAPGFKSETKFLCFALAGCFEPFKIGSGYSQALPSRQRSTRTSRRRRVIKLTNSALILLWVQKRAMTLVWGE